MSGPPYDLAGAAAYAFVALVWAIVADDAWRFGLASSPRRPLSLLLPLATTSLTCFYGLYALAALLLPSQSAARAPRWYDLTDVALVAGLAFVRHLARHLDLEAAPPSRWWLGLTYGLAVVLAMVSVFPELIPAPTPAHQVTVARLPLPFYVVGMLALILRDVYRFARPGRWRGSAPVARAADVLFVALAVVGAAGVFVLLSASAREPLSAGYLQVPPLLNAGFGLLVLIPLAGRILGNVVRRSLFVLVVLAAAAMAWTAIVQLAGRIETPMLRELAGVAVIAGLVLAALGLRGPLWTALDRLIFRRGRRRRAELQQVLQMLSPELGARECCRRLAEAVTRILQLQGIAIFLTRGRGEAVAGEIDVAPLRALWGDGAVAASLPDGTFALAAMRELPAALRDALIAAEVVGGVTFTSPRQRWGAAFVTAGALGDGLDADDRHAVAAMADQLARVLDGAELLERALAVERDLAHAAKLATIGETAARIAHDIRNPVAAARSLAQQLAREAAPNDREAAALILQELDRVERQVRALLRFARKEEFRFEPLDLGALARTTLKQLRDRLDAAGIAVELRAAGEVMARADSEKLRQVLLNVVENALDAMREAGGRLQVTVQNGHDVAVLQVVDTGPGVPAGDLPHLFEPFFSRKAHGTGLGLAIAKRTVDAHGGTITATSRPGAGTTVSIELPRAGHAP